MKTLLALEVLEHTIRYIILEDKANSLAVIGTGAHAIEVGPSHPGALADCVKAIIAEHKLKVSRVFLTVNRQDSVVHQLSLSKMSSSDLDSIIAGEIDKIPQFSDRDFVYIHKAFDAQKKNMTRVVFGVIADELLQYLVKEIESVGLPCQDLEIAPLNSIGLLLSDEYKQGTQGLIVLGDHTTYLIVFNQGQINYLYSTHSGLKDLFPMSQMNTVQTSSWLEEIKRALKSYSLEEGALSQIHLIWDQDQAPNFNERISKEFATPVKPIDMLKSVSGESINPIYFLAAVPALYHATKLQPSFSLKHFFKDIQNQKMMQRSLVAASVVCGLLIVGCCFGLLHFNNVKQTALLEGNTIDQEIANIEQQSPEIFKLRDDYTKTRDQLLYQATYVRLLNRMAWSQALSAVASELPSELSLTSFKVDENGQATVTGEAFQMESVAKLLRQVESSSILENGKFDYINEQLVDSKKIFTFGILASMKLGEES